MASQAKTPGGLLRERETARMRPYRVPDLSKRLFLLPLVLGTLLVAGCGKGEIARYPVRGYVIVDGQPAEGVMVIFYPVGGSEELQRHRPFGFTDPDGKFELTTLNKADGSPSGEYKVLAQWSAQGGGDGRDGAVNMGPDRLRGRYMNLETTPLTAKIEDGPAELPPFDLKSR